MAHSVAVAVASLLLWLVSLALCGSLYSRETVGTLRTLNSITIVFFCQVLVQDRLSAMCVCSCETHKGGCDPC